jgi:hypothetical protein
LSVAFGCNRIVQRISDPLNKDNQITINTLNAFFKLTKLLPKPKNPVSHNEKWGFRFLVILQDGQQNSTPTPKG